MSKSPKVVYENGDKNMTAVNETKPWQVTPNKVKAAIHKIIKVCNPLKLILFGSYVENKTTLNSDIDFLVITPNNIENPRKESVRIRRELRGISMPMDILVVPQEQWELLKDQPGLIYREANNKGQVVYES